MEEVRVKKIPMAAVEYINYYPRQGDMIHINVNKADLPGNITPLQRGEIIAVEIRGVRLRALISNLTSRSGNLIVMGNLLR